MIRAALCLALCGACSGPSAQAPAAPSTSADRVLIFTRTAGYRHASIPDGVSALTELAAELGLEVTATEDPAALLALDDVAVVVFLSTTGDVLDAAQQAGLERFIQGGGGWLGVHAATDTEYDWPWYTELAGAQFASHPQVQTAELARANPHPSVDFLPEPWVREDEWYDFKALSPHITPLLWLDEASYSGHAQMGAHPAAWYHTFDGGRAWYTAGGHTRASFAEPLFRRHLREGLRWCAGRAN